MNNGIAKLAIPPTELDRRAAAFADVQQTHEDLRKALDIISTQKAELDRKDDRIAMVLSDCDRLRNDNHRLSQETLVFRDKCIELATAQANIGLMCVSANNVVMSVRELTERAGEKAITDDQAF